MKRRQFNKLFTAVSSGLVISNAYSFSTINKKYDISLAQWSLNKMIKTKKTLNPINFAQKAKELGFSGKGSIHPKQIPILNQVFTPTDQEIEKAKKITSTFENANTGLVVINGKLIEKPVLREMYRILSIAERVEFNKKLNLL